MKSKILVTGGAGFVGSALAEKLADNADNFVVVVDNLLTGSMRKVPASKHNNVKFIKADVNDFSDISSIFYAYAFDYVFHYAAVVGVKRTLDHPSWVLKDLTGLKNILDLSKNTGVKRVYFSSSSEVYGEPVEYPQNETTTPLNSRLPYAIVKNLGEAYLRAYKQEFDLDFTIFRFFNTYGPKQSTDFVMSKFIEAALSDKDITIYGDGSQTRTFCYVDDNVEACLNAFYTHRFVNDVINVGNDHETSILELAQLIKKILNSKSNIVHLPALKEGDMTRRCPDIGKMKILLNRELTPLEIGMERVIEVFRNKKGK
ncbi:MAG TPA: NAD-dependent epimerase/dehydratase family protein [Bacteroidia bacterium]|nr:NAD-dependent epimerase/dehydratase family protein [Bacteroidia bacterium]HQP01144.1 NAD-dependent epimerase/dehydratase family protein [Bacteroidia bacterium]HRE23841.1 NAD-dependent epimerase/dehydratase family protein [Bacteroidia bacterium]HRH84985.1 NAD-dependent epimerase/dehydratase family protein [Bacteroidia bacterium]HRR23043.1 NAD-dependent epimerase/dehydratase family protein [Bacteroidia bacterium]